MNDTDQNQHDEHGQKHGYWVERHDDGDVWDGRISTAKNTAAGLNKTLRRCAGRQVSEGRRYGYWMIRYVNGGVEHKDYGVIPIYPI